jgi:hypothetical protein
MIWHGLRLANQLVPVSRIACPMQDHHRELTVHFAEREALSAYTAAMSSAGYADELEESER